MRPRIALTGVDTPDGRAVYIRAPQTYFAAVWQAGGFPLLVQLDEGQTQEILAQCQGLLLTGGGDVDPALYGQARHPATDGISAARDGSEIALVRAFYRAGKPILAICRGIQVLAVALGGTLHQHVPDLPGVRIDHSDYAVRHGVTLASGSLLHTLYGEEQIRVNSTHHQTVDALPPGFVVCARSEDGLIEGIEGGGALGVQWHPERILGEGAHGALFGWLTRQAAN